MKVDAGLFALALAGFSSLAAAQPHGNKAMRHVMHNVHARAVHARNPAVETQVVTVTRTVSQYGNIVNTQQAASSTAAPSPQETADESFVVEAASTSLATRSTDSSNSEPTASSGVDKDFPDGELDCDHFPSEYGAVSTDWVTKEGWSGIQIGDGNGDSVGECSEGALCSYACPPGYSKAQWPSEQPSTGESRGGLQCKNGKLHLTRTEYPKLCQKGVGTASVVNNLDKFVPVCRTDYPGSENMVIPLSCDPGSTLPITVPDAEDSYTWEGKPTSAQYYVNPAGTSLEDGCIWGKPDDGLGNWSPIVIGAGYRDGKTWLSISQNELYSGKLNFDIKIEGDDLSDECWVKDGKFPSGTGCTVAVNSGSAKFVLS